ncbi:MAG: TonB-dependent receptor [Rhodopirellula sp.]|nr:TonB-dependent receptor [Rhodopirellula sp.]
MTGCHRCFGNRLPLAGMLTALIFGACSTGNAKASDERVEATKGTNSKIQSTVYMDALQQPGGLDEMSVDDDGQIQFISLHLYQDVAPLQPLPLQTAPNVAPTPAAPRSVAAIFRGRSSTSPIQLASQSMTRNSVAADRVLGIESKARATTDVGSLLGKSSRSKGIVAQKRSPIITDPRIRGSRVGQLAASGSHWIPARIDLDTVLSKIDSDLISSVDVVKGPYAVEYGPGTSFLSFDLATSPRSDSSPVMGGSTSLEYKTNGEQWYGRQTASYADEDWGARVGYGHRTGSDYDAGDGQSIPSSYKSRDLDVAVGFDVSPGQSLELFYLHQDQTDVELAGQAFDIDSLVTDAFESTWINENVDWADRLEVEGWYNQSDLRGSAQRPSKRQTFPFLDVIRFTGTTNIQSVSTGARAAATWEHDDLSNTRAGVDVRVIRQALDEISSGQFGFSIFNDANSPIPKSASVNPGLFIEHNVETESGTAITIGARTDIVTAEVLDPRSSLQNVGTGSIPLSAILGTDDFNQSFGLWSTFLTVEHPVDQNWTVNGGIGYGMRPPSLTEMYVAESFMFLLQSGLNTVTGDPRLNAERQLQIDVGIDYSDERFSASGNFFHAWVHDRITFENLSVRRGPPFGQIEQTNLKYVNTELATLFGFEADAEWQFSDSVELFGQVSYVQGTDQTRNGDFATLQAQSQPLTPSQRVDGLPRGAFSGVAGGAEEPLPGIAPLQSRLGVRLLGDIGDAPFSIEIAARIVDNQNRVASSLLESRTPGFTVWDTRGVLQMTESITVFAGVENLTDKNYREHFDFRSQGGQSVRQPGVNFYFGSQVVY